MSTQKKPNYRIYDRTGGGGRHDIYAASLEEAIQSGREWIEDGNWASTDGAIRKGLTLDACVRPITFQPQSPEDIAATLNWDLRLPEWDEHTHCWYINVTNIHGNNGEDDETGSATERQLVAKALSLATTGTWTYSHEWERCIWNAVPADWPMEDITDDQQENDCSGSHYDEEPKCAIGGGTDDDTGHEWRQPYSVVGGCRENPGFWSGGGTIIISKSVCARCGQHRTVTDNGDQRNPGDPEATVKIEDVTETSKEWLVCIHEKHGWIPQWLAEHLDRPPTTRYTEETAKEYVAEHDDDDELDADDLEHVFAALAGRRPTDADRKEGLWSHCVQLAG